MKKWVLCEGRRVRGKLQEARERESEGRGGGEGMMERSVFKTSGKTDGRVRWI